MSKADFSGGNLQDCLFADSNLSFARFRNATVKGLYADRADFTEADLTKASILGAHLEGARFNDAELVQTNLSSANLRGATLERACLDHAMLCGALFPASTLIAAQFRKADASRANFKGADLRDVDFSDANLNNAELCEARGLKHEAFARANLAGATLPTGFGFDALLNAAQESSKNCHTLFLAVVAACAYAALTVATTADANLVLDIGGSSTLPIVAMSVNMRIFYPIASWLLLLSFIYLQVYLQRMWERMSRLPAVLPDGRTIDRATHPWLLAGVPRRYFYQLRTEPREHMRRLEDVATSMLAWWLPPLTMTLLFWRTLVLGDRVLSAVQFVACVIASWTAVWCFRCARQTLSGAPQESPFGRRRAAGVLVLSIGALLVLIPSQWRKTQVTAYAADLRGKVIRPGASLVRADLRVADLTGARLDGNDFSAANLFRANLSHARVTDTKMYGADLRGANFSNSVLANVDLRNSDLAGAIFTDVTWGSAFFENADLTGANLSGMGGLRGFSALVRRKGHPEEKVLGYFDLDGVNLTRANLSGAMLMGAHLRTLLEGANLQKAQLQSAKLAGAKLGGADLRGADLSGADLSGADLSGADLTHAHLTGAKLGGAHLVEVDLTGATFGGKDGTQKACRSSMTTFPTGFDVEAAALVMCDQTWR